MKRKMLLAVVFIFTTSFVYSQKEKNEPIYSIGLKVYNPIILTGTDKFYNDNWLLWSGQERTYTKYAIGLDYEHHLSENISLKLWAGFSKRSLEETYYDEYSYYTASGQSLPALFSENLEYDQTSFNISPGISFSTELNKFELKTGFELSYLHTGSGDQTYILSMTQYRDSTLKDSIYFRSDVSFSSGNSYGIGVFIGAEYNIFNNLSVGTEFHSFLFYSIFDDNTDFDYYHYVNYAGVQPAAFKSNGQLKENFKQFSFSAIMPAIEIRYKF